VWEKNVATTKDRQLEFGGLETWLIQLFNGFVANSMLMFSNFVPKQQAN
jgi:hypothetical protein